MEIKILRFLAGYVYVYLFDLKYRLSVKTLYNLLIK
jgi:hypothetical protein